MYISACMCAFRLRMCSGEFRCGTFRLNTRCHGKQTNIYIHIASVNVPEREQRFGQKGRNSQTQSKTAVEKMKKSVCCVIIITPD